MKSVLLIDASPMLREFVSEKLLSENVSVEVADGQRDALPKFLSVLPDLVIIDVENSISDIIDFLEKKQADPNGKKIPIIMSGPKIEQYEAADLVQYGVIKYYTRPIKFDLYFDSIGRVLHSAFSIDTTPCVLDMHLNKDIIFIEIARGLNREKITLLKYKLAELIETNKLALPKLILMMSDLKLSYVDGLNLELLLDNITADRRIVRRNIKILSFDKFISDFLDGHPVYDGIKVVENLSEVITSLVSHSSDSVEDTISEKILAFPAPDEKTVRGAVRFYSDADTSTSSSLGGQLNIAVINNDMADVKYLKEVLETIGEVTVFLSSKDFMSKVRPGEFDFAVSGMAMPEATGLDILNFLVQQKITLPVILYSNIIQKEVIMQALKFGASSYLIKPQPPEVIVQKALEIINARN